jgi:iron complex transport system ATP-binding protein
MLSLQEIYYNIGKKNILQDISVDFYPGEFNMILGPNGAGKSTLLKIFSGELTGFSGSVFYDKKNIVTLKKETLARFRSVMSQQPELSFPLKVNEIILMGRYPHFNFNPNKIDLSICEEVITMMNLDSLKERNYLTLSGGEKQRVQFARVLAQIWEKPSTGHRYLFLDEPLISLDINYQQEFLRIASEFKKTDIILVAIVHDINLAIQFADKLLFLKQGQLKAYGKPSDVLNEELIKNIFNIEATIINNPITNKPLVIFN